MSIPSTRFNTVRELAEQRANTPAGFGRRKEVAPRTHCGGGDEVGEAASTAGEAADGLGEVASAPG